MVDLRMKVAGECTNGEWNTLWCRGNTHPVSILQDAKINNDGNINTYQ